MAVELICYNPRSLARPLRGRKEVPECPLSSMRAGMASALARIAHEILERNSTVDETPNSAPTSCLGAQRLPIQI